MQIDTVKTELTAEDIAAALRLPTNFGLSRDADHHDDIGTTWALGPVIETRDSDLVDRANAIALKRELVRRADFADQWTITHAGHWAVGWVDHLTYRVLDDDGEPTEIARFLAGWFACLQEVYPIADEMLLSEMECEAESENWALILDDVRRAVRRNAPDLDERIDDMSDEKLDELIRAHGIQGESDGEGWRNYSSHEIGKLIDALRALVARAARRNAPPAARPAHNASHRLA
jgi:hypothetical protein